ncbi:MAG: hypothetical protein ACSHXF_08770 [Aquaticitalea sp.]
MKHLNKELFSLILIVMSGILILGLAVGIVYFIDTLFSLHYGILYIIGYIALTLGAHIAGKRTNDKRFKRLKRILLLPFTLLIGFLSVAMPYFVLQIHLFVYLFFSAIIPILCYRIDRMTHLLDLKITTHIYLIVTLSVIMATLMNKQMKQLTYRFSPMQLYSNHISKRFEFNQLTEYFLSEHTIKFVIYFSYFLYLLIFNLFTFQEHSVYSSPLMDRAVLQSFITFLALERLLSNLKELDFKPSEMLKLLLTSMTGSDKVDHTKMK